MWKKFAHKCKCICFIVMLMFWKGFLNSPCDNQGADNQGADNQGANQILLK